MRAPGERMKSIDALVKKAIELKEKGLSDKEIGDELHLSPETVTGIRYRGAAGASRGGRSLNSGRPMRGPGEGMKSIDALVKKAIELKEKGLSDKEIGDELHLSPETVTWLLSRGVGGGAPPKDVKIGWRSIGV